MPENRLELIDADLSARLERLSTTQQRAAALAACHAALERTGLSDPILDEGLEALEHARYGSSLLQKQIETFVASLDQVQWDLHDLMDEGRADEATYLAAFQRARAAHSVYFALDADPFRAVTESIYEANAAIGDLASLRATVLAALGKRDARDL